MSTSSPEAIKKLLENMQTDLRSLSMECKKKFPPVKEVVIWLSDYITILALVNQSIIYDNN